MDLDLIRIGDPGNKPDQANRYASDQYRPGAVANEFAIGRTHVTVGQFREFLHSTGRSGTVDGDRNLPALMTWLDAAYFCNWLHFGKTSRYQGTSEEGAYDTSGSPNNLPAKRNPGARYWIPDPDEWAKAAYYHPATGTYSQFPTRADHDMVPQGEYPPGGSNSANCTNSSFVEQRPTPRDRTPVGAYPAASSYYGLHDCLGNVNDWLEPPSEDPRFYLESPPRDGYRYGMRKVAGGFHGWDADHGEIQKTFVFGTHFQMPTSRHGLRVCADVSVLDEAEPVSEPATEPEPEPTMEPESQPDLSRVRYELDQGLGLYRDKADPGDYWLNFRGEREKYIRGVTSYHASGLSAIWYIVTPDGNLHELNKKSYGQRHTLYIDLVQFIGVEAYDNPALITDAPDPDALTEREVADLESRIGELPADLQDTVTRLIAEWRNK